MKKLFLLRAGNNMKLLLFIAILLITGCCKRTNISIFHHPDSSEYKKIMEKYIGGDYE